MSENVNKKGKKSPDYEHCRWGEGRTCFMSHFVMSGIDRFLINHKLQNARNLENVMETCLKSFQITQVVPNESWICDQWYELNSESKIEWNVDIFEYLATKVFLFSGNAAKCSPIRNCNFKKIKAEGLAEHELPRKNDLLLHSASLCLNHGTTTCTFCFLKL